MSESIKKGYTRKRFLKTVLAGMSGLATWSVLGGCNGGSYTRGDRGLAAQSIPFNTDWRFGEYTPGSVKPGFDDSIFKQVMLPHTVAEQSWGNFDPESWEKVWTYRRWFDLDKDLTNKRIFVDFGAAMTASTVTLNGQQVGKHIGGYLPFSFEITDYLKDSDNLLTVELDSRYQVNTPPNRPGQKTTSIDFWQPGGLYREAQLRIVPRVFVADVFAKPTDVLADSGPNLEVECTIDGVNPSNGSAEIIVQVLDGDRQIGTTSETLVLSESGKTTKTLKLQDLDVELWSIDNPVLYDVVVILSMDGEGVHDYAARTGFRKAEFRKDGFYMNGQRVQLFGLNRHHVYPFAGGAMPDRVQHKDAEILKKELNCNMVRCSHYPQAESFFDACDELGLMAFEEVAGWGMWLGNEVWKQRVVRDVENMVRAHRNHPSIVVWGTRMNETPDNVELNTKTRDMAHRLDDSRQTTGSIGGWDHGTKRFVQDVFSYNDYSNSKDENDIRWPDLQPPRSEFPYLVSEAVGTLSGPAKHYRRIDPAYMQQGQAEAHALVHNIAGSDQNYCGLLAWSGYDYPSGNGNQYGGVKYTGVIDLFRVPKPGAAIYQAQIDPQIRPVIALAFYWDFGPKSLPFKDHQRAMICSNCERLELFIDGQHLTAVYPAAERFNNLRYPPSFVNLNDVDGSAKPELRIDGYLGEDQVVSRSFSSDTAGDQLSLVADDQEINADGADATRVVFRAVDKYGAPRPHVNGEIKLTLEGPASIIGDNPFALDKTGGVGAVWVRTAPGRTGNIRLSADHTELGGAAVNIATTKSERI